MEQAKTGKRQGAAAASDCSLLMSNQEEKNTRAKRTSARRPCARLPGRWGGQEGPGTFNPGHSSLTSKYSEKYRKVKFKKSISILKSYTTRGYKNMVY